MAGGAYELENEARDAEIIRLRREHRLRPRSIATELGCSLEVVNYTIKHYVEAAQARNHEIVAQAFTEQADTIEYLLELVMQVLSRGYDRDAIRCAIQLLERQAKLMNLDKTPKTGNAQSTHDKDWLEAASPEELVTYARQMGLPIPDDFLKPQPLLAV